MGRIEEMRGVGCNLRALNQIHPLYYGSGEKVKVRPSE